MGAIKELCPQMSYCVVNRRRVYTDRRELRLSSSSVLDTDDCCDIGIIRPPGTSVPDGLVLPQMFSFLGRPYGVTGGLIKCS